MDQFTNYSTSVAEGIGSAPGAGVVDSWRWQRSPDSSAPPFGTPSWRPVLEELQRRGASSEPISRLQRALEIVAGSILLAITFPLMVLVALIIKLDSPGPVVFRQIRVGRNGRLFRFAKFRTLYVDARQRWPDLYAYSYTADEVAALHFKLKNDPRVTRVGRWLRKSTLDELPNLWNVVTGDVALVGPRPEIPEMLPYYDNEGLEKFSVRPGVTGLAQVFGRGDLSFVETVRYDLEYARTHTWRLDCEVLLRTVFCTLLRKGAF
jgi:lipopolysaccharide/colanic/teichoic acid biosynthesis glycosyltransferase